MVEVRVCKTCKQEFPLTKEYFYENGRKTGYVVKCKECYKRAVQERRDSWTEAEYERYKKQERERIRRKRRDDRAFRDRDVLYKREYYQENKDEISEKYKDYLASYSGRITKQICVRRREARKSKLLGTLTLQDWEDALEFFEHSCAYCGDGENLQQEHIVPVSQGGHYVQHNIIPACQNCNIRKSNKDLEEWFIDQAFFSQERLLRICKWVNGEKVACNI